MNRPIFPDFSENGDMFKTETKKLYRESNPISSKLAALKVKSFKKGHEDKIRDLLKQYNGSTPKELETLSKDTENEITFIQIGKRTGAMTDVKTGNYKKDGCMELWLKENV
jgi:hypothetical protein